MYPERELVTPKMGTTMSAAPVVSPALSGAMTTKEAADYIGMSPATLNGWRFMGEGPVYLKMGTGKRAKVAYLREDLDEWLRTRRTDPASVLADA